MSISNELRLRISIAHRREWDDDHLSPVERHVLCQMISEQDNIHNNVSEEQIYEEYVIDNS